MKNYRKAYTAGTFFFFNLGCPKNIEDAERVASRLKERGWEEVSDPSHASLLVVTTCAFIPEAEEQSVEEIIRVASAKEKWQKLAVLGCLVSKEDGALYDLFPEVDCFLDVEHMKSLADRAEIGCEEDLEFDPLWVRERLAVDGRRLFTPPHLAYLKIARGCSNHCSYCIIPSLRGELRSRSPESVLREVEELARLGIKEIVIIAQDSSSWGFDREGDENLTGLLKRIKDVAGDIWLRLMYLHPAHIDPVELLHLVDEGVILPYLDIPVQHASDFILRRMDRGYGSEYLKRIFGIMRSEHESLVLRTTVMVGFPGEREEDFLELIGFLERFEFDHVGVFEFAAMPGTKAADMESAVKVEESRFRKDEILDLQMDISQSRLSRLQNRRLELVVDEVIPPEMKPADSIWGIGRYYGQCYEIDGVAYLSGNKAEVGSSIYSTVKSVDAYNLFCEL
jgi:ribosomal protein S12 methylthiotransferase